MPEPSNNLRAILEQRQGSETQLAEALGVSRSTVNRWVTGARMIAEGQAAKICEVLNVEMGELLLGHLPSAAANEPHDEPA